MAFTIQQALIVAGLKMVTFLISNQLVKLSEIEVQDLHMNGPLAVGQQLTISVSQYQ